MIDVSRNAMHSNKYRETPNVRTGPAFAADQVAPNSYLQMILVTPAQSHLLHLLRLHQMMSLGDLTQTWEKPIPPSTYNGSDDPKKVARFIQECEQYLKMAKVADEDKVFRISRYLEGPARDFYDQSVSMNYNEWNIDTFFWELFNYCFPRDYRAMPMRLVVRTETGPSAGVECPLL